MHRIARVDDEVHHDLLELAGIDDDRAEVGAGLDAQLDVLADQAAEHRLHRDDGGSEIERPRRHHLLAAEREQLARQLGGALACAIDLLDVLGDRLAGGRPRRSSAQ